jgi:hypothetical protein
VMVAGPIQAVTEVVMIGTGVGIEIVVGRER